MSHYMILSKPSGKDIADNDDNQVISLSKNDLCFILPKNLSSCYLNNGLFEANLIDWCKQFCSKSKITLDIGAHTGTYGISLSKNSKEVYCFEPQKMTYYALCGSVALSNLQNIKCMQLALFLLSFFYFFTFFLFYKNINWFRSTSRSHDSIFFKHENII